MYIYIYICMHLVYSLIDDANVRISSSQRARIGERQKVVNPWEVPPPAQHLGDLGQTPATQPKMKDI